MSTKKISDKTDPEYQYPKEQFGDEMAIGADDADERPVKVKKKLPKRKLFLGIFILIMAILVYLFLSKQEKNAMQITRQEITSPVISKQPSKTPETRKNTNPSPVAVTKTVTPPTEKMMDLLKNQPVAAQSEVNSQGVQTQLETMKQGMESLHSTVLTLTNTVETLSNQVGQIKGNRSVSAPINSAIISSPMPESKPIEREIYYLKALIPGRAWIYSPKGSFTSVRVGDTIKGYGTVTAINVAEGVVVTTSEPIRYGPNDS